MGGKREPLEDFMYEQGQVISWNRDIWWVDYYSHNVLSYVLCIYDYNLGMRIVVWYSCGITSAVVAKMILDRYKEEIPIVIAYCDTSSEHPDNKRFLKDCEEWFDYPITILHSEKYNDIWDVFDKTKYIAGINGARCSLEMKKRVRQEFENIENDIQVFGFRFKRRKKS